MIAKIGNPFAINRLETQINYHQKKIDEGVAQVIFSSTAVDDLHRFLDDMRNYIESNNATRTKNKYIDFSLNLPHGELADDEKFNLLAQEYLYKMGYGNCPYVAIRHDDKDHSHIHIITSTIDFDSKKVSDSNNFERSEKISRALEEKYSLQKTMYNQFNSRNFGELKSREYYFHKALLKGLSNHVTRNMLEPYLKGLPMLKSKDRTQDEYSQLLGENFERVGAILEERGHFTPLLKDELLEKMDAIRERSATISEFQENMKQAGLYMRLVKDEFVYGIPELSFYIKDSRLPKSYRYETMKEEGYIDRLSPDLQSNYIFNNARLAMIGCKSYEQFKDNLREKGISVLEYEKKDDIQLYYKMVGNTALIPSWELSPSLSYDSLCDYFEGVDRTPVPMALEPEQREEVNEKQPTITVGREEDENNLSNESKRRKKKPKRDQSHGM